MLQRRDMFGRGAMLVAGMVLAEPATAQHHDMMDMQGMNGMPMKDCIALCLASHRACIETAGYVIKERGVPARAGLAVMLTDCAELCQATANSMIRNSPLHGVLCRACAEACDRCADACSRHGQDTHLASCAKTCRSCAQACREMAASAP